MADPHKPGEADLLALIAQIHGGSPEEQRESHVEAALTTLEATHRAAARALRDIHTTGMRAGHRALPPGDTGLSAEPEPGGAGARQLPAQAPPEAAAPAPSHGPKPNFTHQEGVTVQSGEGAEVDLGQRTLTQIVRPNRGRR